MPLNPDIIDMVQKLVRFPTVSRESNMELTNFIRDYLGGLGISSMLFPNEDGSKANLYATLGPADVPGIILSGHTDVVPVKDQNWTHEPFEPWTEDGKLFGRGTADMKSFIALALVFCPKMLERGLKMPVHLAFSYDEEVGCTGVVSMISHIAQHQPRPKACIVGEPTDMRVINAHKGIQSFKTKIVGAPAHSSTPEGGTNAIIAAAMLIEKISEMARSEIETGEKDQKFMPPHTTFNIGEIKGGTAVNIVASHASFIWEFRTLPGTNPDKLIDQFNKYAEDIVLPTLLKTAPDASITTHLLASTPPLMALADNEAETIAMLLADTTESGAVAYATEAGHFQKTAEIPTVVCGPGSIDQAHKEDEFITLDQLALGEQFFEKLLDIICIN
ncbi:MAG: acetylornithine deacetylase [Candidatus Marinimicrobia bacterium]|nr:acetylornithine deacetylase [Candidatus Neomarinimicrobiota bacterium]